MKILIVFMLVFSFSFPAMANQAMLSEVPVTDVSFEELGTEGMLEYYELQKTELNQPVNTDEKAISFYRCYASPRYWQLRNYRYYGNSFYRRSAAIQALRTCNYYVRRMSYIGSRWGCRVTYCLRFLK